MAPLNNVFRTLVFAAATVVIGRADLSKDKEQALFEKMATLERDLANVHKDLADAQHQLRNIPASGEMKSKKGHYGRRMQAAADPWDGAPSATDSIWLILCGSLVMFMQCGFAMLEMGACRAKNAQNIMLKNLADVCVGTIGWWAFGWAFAYGGPSEDGLNKNRFMGTKQFFGIGFLTTDSDGNQTPDPDGGALMLSWFFQWAFCSAAATIVSGGVAERVQFPGYLIYSFMMTAFIYPVVVCWTWGYGWLAGGTEKTINTVGYMDFAGSGVVHMSGGVGALIGAIAAGPRKGRFTTSDPSEFDAHSVPFVVLGTFTLWFGWYGFNCGSTLGLSDAATGAKAAQVAMNTTIAAATGGLTVALIVYILTRKYDVVQMCSGILAGLVSITAPCSNVESGSAFAIGLIGGFIMFGSSKLLKFCKVDDPLDAFPIHGACGAWGVLAAALFDWGKGFDYAHGWNGFGCITDDSGACKSGAWSAMFAANIVEVLVIGAWVAFFSAAIFFPLRMAGLLRADDELQVTGMDQAKHSPSKAYGDIVPAVTEITITK